MRPVPAARLMAVLTLLMVPAFLAARQDVDLTVVDRIETEAFDHSKVMDHLHFISDVYGPRLTASPEFEQAANWTIERLRGYGLSNVHVEPWGPFGRRWSLKHASAEMVEPRYAMLAAAPLAWSAPTDGPVTAEPVVTPLDTRVTLPLPRVQKNLDAYRAEWAGKLRGKIVMLASPRRPDPSDTAEFSRYTDAELADLAKAPTPSARLEAKTLDELPWPDSLEAFTQFYLALPPALADELRARRQKLLDDRAAFFAKEGVAAILLEDRRAQDGLVFAEAAGPRGAGRPFAPPTFVVTAEQYGRIARLVADKQTVRIRIDLAAATTDNDVEAWNLVGEIPGGARKDEVVMIGAHFDSWHTGTGATDDGAGSAVMIEVMRILKTLNLPLDRTVRIALWSGEEQGLLGSKAYVKAHFGDPKTGALLPEHQKLSGYFNLDNGSGKIRGVYLQGHAAMRPIFERWLAPFRDLGVSTVTIRNTGGTDHLSFCEVGLPGFQFVQDPLDYSTITHHSNMDTYDHAVAADLMQAAAVIASVVYDAANAPQMLPRRPRAASSPASAPSPSAK
jgi:carboxypeptidase Q